MTPLLNAQPKTWSRVEYYQLAEEGYFRGQRVERIGGLIIAMTPQGVPHSDSISRANTTLVRHFGDTHYVRVQLPLELEPDSDPEPDFALVPISALGHGHHPRAADLVLEVSASSLAYDREEKASLYARNQIPEYVVLNVRSRLAEVHTQPRVDPDAPFGYSYACVTSLSSQELWTPVALGRPISVSDLF